MPTTVPTARKRKRNQSNTPKLQMLLSTVFHQMTRKNSTLVKCVRRRRRWIVACRLESLNVTRHTRICSKHFEGGLGPTKANPVPTIFDFPKHLQRKEMKQRQDPFTTSLMDSLSSVNSTASSWLFSSVRLILPFLFSWRQIFLGLAGIF